MLHLVDACGSNSRCILRLEGDCRSSRANCNHRQRPPQRPPRRDFRVVYGIFRSGFDYLFCSTFGRSPPYFVSIPGSGGRACTFGQLRTRATSSDGTRPGEFTTPSYRWTPLTRYGNGEESRLRTASGVLNNQVCLALLGVPAKQQSLLVHGARKVSWFVVGTGVYDHRWLFALRDCQRRSGENSRLLHRGLAGTTRSIPRENEKPAAVRGVSCGNIRNLQCVLLRGMYEPHPSNFLTSCPRGSQTAAEAMQSGDVLEIDVCRRGEAIFVGAKIPCP